MSFKEHLRIVNRYGAYPIVMLLCLLVISKTQRLPFYDYGALGCLFILCAMLIASGFRKQSIFLILAAIFGCISFCFGGVHVWYQYWHPQANVVAKVFFIGLVAAIELFSLLGIVVFVYLGCGAFRKKAAHREIQSSE
ncbi:MAG: hypothetical protein NTY53_14180 [Kiritimatiellaeota bacterium]|nr:hypothetical protein [Kiritimatiellota bacterium]